MYNIRTVIVRELKLEKGVEKWRPPYLLFEREGVHGVEWERSNLKALYIERVESEQVGGIAASKLCFRLINPPPRGS